MMWLQGCGLSLRRLGVGSSMGGYGRRLISIELLELFLLMSNIVKKLDACIKLFVGCSWWLTVSSKSWLVRLRLFLVTLGFESLL